MMAGHVRMNIYKQYIDASGGSGLWGLLLLAIFLEAGVQLGYLFWLAYWVDSPRSADKIWFFLTIFCVFGIASLFLSVPPEMTMIRIAYRAGVTIHDALLDAIMRVSTTFFDSTPVGRVIARFSEDMYQMDMMVPKTTVFTVKMFAQCCMIIGTVVVILPPAMVLVIPCMILVYFLQDYYIQTSRALQRLMGKLAGPIYSHFGETIAGVSTIRAFKAMPSFIAKNYNNINAETSAYWAMMCANRWLAVRLEIIGHLITGGTALACVLMRESVSAGFVGLALTTITLATLSLNLLIQHKCALEEQIVSVERMKQYQDVPKERANFSENDPPASWPSKGKIEIRNLSMRYREGLDLVLKGMSLEIEGGERVGVCGRTGSGKSTIMKCLLRIVEPEKGSEILIDGVNVLDIGLFTLRSSISMIPQGPTLFTGTIRFNLDPFSDHSDEELIQSLKIADLWETVEQLEDGLDGKVLPGGSNFSVGQRQLFCLARAVLRRKAKILLLDEATSAVDNDTDSFIQEAIATHFKTSTVLVIAHRIDTILDCDRVLVIDDGKIVETGEPKELLADPTTHFHHLAKLHFGEDQD